MPHSIKVGFISAREHTQMLINAIVEKNIIKANNICISDADDERCVAYKEMGAQTFSDDVSTLMKCEIIIAMATKKELSTTLSKVSTLTRGKFIVAICDGIDCEYVKQRLAGGTAVAVSPSDLSPENIHFSTGFLSYMKPACIDIVNALD